MTRHLVWFAMIAITCFGDGRCAWAQFELSEPDPDNSSAAEQIRKDTSNSSASNRGRQSVKTGAAGQGESIPQTNIVLQRQSKSLPDPGVPRDQQDSALELLSEDGVAGDFFSGPIPRTKAIGEDAALNDVCHVGDRCWAVGDRGVVCTSEDGGLSWTTAFTPMECSLRSVCFLTNSIGWVAGVRVIPETSQETAVLLQTRDGGRSWHDLSARSSRARSGDSVSTASMPGILHVQFFGLEEAIAITRPVHSRGGHGIFRSGDGGETWSAIASDQAGGEWNAAHFLSDSEGIVVGGHQSYAAVVANQAVLINPPQPTLRQMRGVSLSQNGEGWIVGDGSTVLTTGNAGVTWRSPENQIPSQLADVIDLHCVAHKGSVVLAAGNPGSVVLRSGSGGADWTLHPVPLSGRINRLRFLTETNVLAIGSFGQVLRSADRGVTWQSVRSSGLRSGLLNLVTDADHAAWQVLASISGESGVRSAVLQISQPLTALEGKADAGHAVLSDSSQLAITQLGANDTASDWMFPRIHAEHHRSSQQLIAEWNRQTDGRLRRLLPLRLARDIRNWRPAVIVIEPASEDDAVAAILREVITQSIRLAAATDESDSLLLSKAGLRPWTVARVVSRVPTDRRATLTFDDADLLPTLGTTIGLLCDASTRPLFDPLRTDQSVRALRSRAGYQIEHDQQETDAVRNLLAGLEESLSSDARRPVELRSREKIELLQATQQKAQLEAAALSRQTGLTDAADSLTGQLREIGAKLPETLALKQLKDLATLNLQQNNMESYFAIQQEVTRRFPSTEDARSAAEMLFLLYSSTECRHYRIRSMFRSPISAVTGSTGSPGSNFRQAPSPGFSVEPVVQPGDVQALSASPGNQLAMLQERWDSHAATALRILSSQSAAESHDRDINPLVLLRQAANLRIQDLRGEQQNRLAEVSRRDDQMGLFAKSEMQVSNPAATNVLPLFNLPRRDERPFLDGKLTESIWETAEEISLKPFVRITAPSDSAEFTQQAKSSEAAVSSLVMLAWDEQFLYLAARLEHPPQKSGTVELVAHRSHDQTHGDRDRLELEFDTDRDFGTSFHLSIDESGLTGDRCWMLDKWDPEWFVAVDSDESAWRLEAAIPLAELADPLAKPGDVWSIRLRRILPGVLQHELVSAANSVSAGGTGVIRFIRPRVVTKSSSRK